MNKNLIENIKEQIKKGEQISPFLFLGKNKELLNSNIKNIALELLKNFEIPNNYLYIFEDNNEKIKIKEIKDFIELSNSRPAYKFQIFFIENISRLNNNSGNSLLKFFEEPWVSNLIFLTNDSESSILETILSRVQTIDLWWVIQNKRNDFYINLLKWYKQDNSLEIISYFFRNKLEKQDYINFLENLILFSKENNIFISFLSEIEEDINWIKNNNVNAKYIVDKWLLKI